MEDIGSGVLQHVVHLNLVQKLYATQLSGQRDRPRESSMGIRATHLHVLDHLVPKSNGHGWVELQVHLEALERQLQC